MDNNIERKNKLRVVMFGLVFIIVFLTGYIVGNLFGSPNNVQAPGPEAPTTAISELLR